MNVLALFDGISCGRLALIDAGIKIDNYFASGEKTRNDNNKKIPIRQYIEPRANNKSNCLSTFDKDNILL